MRARKPSAKARRSAARLAAVQALYQVELSDGEAEAVIREFLVHRLGEEVNGERFVEPDRELFLAIVRGVIARRAELDALVHGVLDAHWNLDRLELLLRCILRAGGWEILAQRAVQPRIILSEYIDLAHAFFGGKEPAMVNAVLDRLARALRADELDGTVGRPAPVPDAPLKDPP